MSTLSKQSKPEASSKLRMGVEKSKKEEQEFGLAKRGIVICSICNAYYYHKAWHHDLSDYKHINEDKDVKFTTCPACQMIKDKKFEGQVIFENVPNQYTEDVISRIKNVGEQATRRDPMDRIISIREGKNKIEVLTTENQLARNIARQIEKAFKGFKIVTKFSKEESVVRVVANFDSITDKTR